VLGDTLGERDGRDVLGDLLGDREGREVSGDLLGERVGAEVLGDSLGVRDGEPVMYWPFMQAQTRAFVMPQTACPLRTQAEFVRLGLPM